MGSSMFSYMLPILLGTMASVFIWGQNVHAQSYGDSPPSYNYENLPETSFSCQGRIPGRYYPDPETDCQMFHVCVKMNNKDVKGFKFLCPNGTVFDSEHQVCIEYYQVVCHSEVGTNPLGHIFEIYKLSSDKAARELDIGKPSFVKPGAIEKNTLGDDFQVEEHNTNHLASSQNTLNYRSEKLVRPVQKGLLHSTQKTRNSNKAKEDIFFNSKILVRPSTFDSFGPTINSKITATTELLPSTPRRPSLETFESYETESFTGFIPTKNGFNREHYPSPDFDSSTEDSGDEKDTIRSLKTSITPRPLIFQNTFRTTLSYLSSTLQPNISVQQTFQQQPSQFNDEYFTKIPSTTRRPVLKTAQFFLHSTNADDYYTSEYGQSTANPFNGQKMTRRTTTTTIRPTYTFQSYPKGVHSQLRSFNFSASRFPQEPYTTRQLSRGTLSESLPTTISTMDVSTTEAIEKYLEPKDDPEVRNTMDSNEFNKNKTGSDISRITSTPSHQFTLPFSSKYTVDETLRPRNANGGSVNSEVSSATIRDLDASSHQWNNFGFSTVPPPTTAEPFSTPFTLAASSAAVTQAETFPTRSHRSQSLKKATNGKNPERFAKLFGRRTTTVAEITNPVRKIRVRSTTSAPFYSKGISSSTETTIIGREKTYRNPNIVPMAVNISSSAPFRGGIRKRVRVGKRTERQNLDPQLKYTRRGFEAGRVDHNRFNAELSIFKGDANLNNFMQTMLKVGNEGSQTPFTEAKESQNLNGNKKVPGNESEKPGRENKYQQITNGTAEGGGPQVRRRVVKRIRPKLADSENETVVTDVTPKNEYIVTGSTLRPVMRISVKTKLGGKVPTTFESTEIADSFPTHRTRLLTTEKSKLVGSASTRIEQSSLLPFKKQLRPRLVDGPHLLIKVLSDKSFLTTSSGLSFLTTEKPNIVTISNKIPLKPVSDQLPPGKSEIENTTEVSNTRSPEYDYA